MSVSLVLIPLAVAYGATVGSAAIASLLAAVDNKSRTNAPQVLEPVDTCFTDAALLQKTLAEHGLSVRALGEHDFVVETEAGTLHYFRPAPGAPFRLQAMHVADVDELLRSIDSLENEYGRNVQSFTYHHVLDELAAHGMTLDEEELLEDDTLVLRLNI